MHRLPEKLLIIMLTLLLGLAPLQGALAGIFISTDQHVGMQQMPDSHADAMVMDHSTSHDCVQNMDDKRCSGHSCSSGHCASCALGLTASFAYTAIFSSAPKSNLTDERFVSQTSSLLFRPPRA
jgi:hypothetical protein